LEPLHAQARPFVILQPCSQRCFQVKHVEAVLGGDDQDVTRATERRADATHHDLHE
jgi:hypothetical protein